MPLSIATVARANEISALCGSVKAEIDADYGSSTLWTRQAVTNAINEPNMLWVVYDDAQAVMRGAMLVTLRRIGAAIGSIQIGHVASDPIQSGIRRLAIADSVMRHAAARQPNSVIWGIILAGNSLDRHLVQFATDIPDPLDEMAVTQWSRWPLARDNRFVIQAAPTNVMVATLTSLP